MFRLNIRSLWLLWIPGAALLAIGVVGDFNHWWDNFGYSTNILAGLTAACFGVPIAATVIQWFLRMETRRQRRQEVAALVRRSIEEICNALIDLSAKEAGAVVALADSVVVEIQDLAFDDPRVALSELRRIENGQRQVEQLVRRFLALGASSEALVASRESSIRNRWRLINETLLFQAESLDMLLISDDLVVSLGRHVHSVVLSHVSTTTKDLAFVSTDWQSWFEEAVSASGSEGERLMSDYQSILWQATGGLSIAKGDLEHMMDFYQVADRALQNLKDVTSTMS